MKLQPHQPSVYPQNPDDSIVLSTGIYDFQHFSDAELQTVRAVLDTSENKYPRKYQGIGLAMEAFSVVYKARYILHEAIIVLYGSSKRSLDQLAVGLAYKTKGAYYYSQALTFIESAIGHISHLEFRYIGNVFPIWSLYNTLSDLCEHENRYMDALKYAKRAAKYKDRLYPYDLLRPGQIYRKMDISLCVQYYEKVRNKNYAQPYISQIDKEYEKAKELAKKCYVYRPRQPKQSKRDAEFEQELHEATLQILRDRYATDCGGINPGLLLPQN